MPSMKIDFFEEDDLQYGFTEAVRKYLPLVPVSARTTMARAGAVMIGARNEGSAPIGALVAQTDAELNCHIVSLFVLPESRRNGVATALVKTLEHYCVEERFAGITAQWAEPQMAEFSPFFSSIGFAKGKDGNRVYEVPLREGKDFTIPGEEYTEVGTAPIPMNKLPLPMRANWMGSGMDSL